MTYKREEPEKVRLPLRPGVRGDAEFSACGRYRYWLSRFWDVPRSPSVPHIEPYALWIGTNPSTADAEVDDPTIRKEQDFTSWMGLRGYIKCNVMDYRATSPKDLLAPGVVPCTQRNLETIVKMARLAEVIIVAYGTLPKKLRGYAERATSALYDRELMCMGITKDGSPRHPLYLRNDAQPVQWRSAGKPRWRKGDPTVDPHHADTEHFP